MDAFLVALMPHFLDLVVAIHTMIIGWLAGQARARWGIEIEARHREALHSALMSGVLRAAEHGWDRDVIAQEALAYARRSAPDAIRMLVRRTASCCSWRRRRWAWH